VFKSRGMDSLEFGGIVDMYTIKLRITNQHKMDNLTTEVTFLEYTKI
jgi:hypothetical protein